VNSRESSIIKADEKLWEQVILWGLEADYPDDRMKEIIADALNDAFEKGEEFANETR
jgi:hypothetical protein